MKNQSMLLNDDVWEKAIASKRKNQTKLKNNSDLPNLAEDLQAQVSNNRKSIVGVRMENSRSLPQLSTNNDQLMNSKYKTHNSRYMHLRYSQAAYGVDSAEEREKHGFLQVESDLAAITAASLQRSNAKANNGGQAQVTDDDGSTGTSQPDNIWLQRQADMHKDVMAQFIRWQRSKNLQLDNFGPCTRPSLKKMHAGKEIVCTMKPPEGVAVATSKYTAPKRWDAAWGRNKVCERCTFPITWCHLVDAACRHCNVVVHGSCLKNEESISRQQGQWVCDDCKQEIDDYNERFLADQERMYRQQLEEKSSMKMAALFRMVMQRKRYKNLQHLAVKMQSHLRCHIFRGKFKRYRQNMPRPLKVFVQRCQNLAICDWDNNLADPYAVIAILNRNHNQIWKMQTKTSKDTLFPDFSEMFTFSGCPAFVTVMFSIVDEDGMRDQFMGQASVPLYKNDLWCKKSKFKLQLGKCRVTPKDSGGIDSPYDYHKIDPKGTIDVEILPQITPRAMCGPMMGPTLEEYQQGRDNNKNAKETIRKLWVSICDKKMHLHKHFGDANNKIVIDMQQARYRLEWKRDAAVFHIAPAKGHSLKLICLDKQSVTRWQLAIELCNLPANQSVASYILGKYLKK